MGPEAKTLGTGLMVCGPTLEFQLALLGELQL